MKEQTPLERLICELEGKIKQNESFSYDSRTEKTSYRNCIKLAESLLPEERKVIIEARITAPTLLATDEQSYREEAEQYFTTKFKQ